MFDLLVSRINASLGQRVSAEERSRTISILDIFGFEHFKTNHFEQFCINYANEKLQGHFNEYNFSLEIQEYQRENIEWSYADFQFQTNTKCIEMIEGKRSGMLALLDEQCKDRLHNTPLHAAVMVNNRKIVKLLLKHGANYDAVNVHGNTALHFSAEWQLASTTKYLLKKGASRDIRNSLEMLPGERVDLTQ